MTGSSINQNATKDSSSSSADDLTKWVHAKVLNIQSTILDDEGLKTNITYANVLQPNTDPKTVSFKPCTTFDRVCQSKLEGEEEFFYVYETFFTRLGLQLPFTDFQMGVLNRINVAPTQLHPNSWAFVRSFELLCESCALTPTVSTFFYYFRVGPKKKKNDHMSWVFLLGRRGRKILNPFEDSYKKFKNHFFQVEGSGGSTFFMDENKKPKFPLYWSKLVCSPNPPASLSHSEQALVKKLNQLEPRNCANLIRCSAVTLNSDMALVRYPNADLPDLDRSEEVDEEDEQAPMKKQKGSMENNPHSPPHHTPSGLNPFVEFDGEGRIWSMWDRRFDSDRHVREQLCFCSDQDMMRNAGYMNVGRFVKTNALRIAAGTEFLVNEVGMMHKEVQCHVKEKHTLQCEVSRLAAELEKEKAARLEAEGQLLEEKIAREKVERQLAMCELALDKTEKESEYTEGCLVRELKKSMTVSFQNAIDQVGLAFPHLNLASITLDPFKIVQGGRLVDAPPRR